MNEHFKGLGHIAVHTKDLAGSIAFYEKIGGILRQKDSVPTPDGEKLLAAHANPDLYPDLVVRVTGFTAYFVSLSPRFRQLVVDRFLNGF